MLNVHLGEQFVALPVEALRLPERAVIAVAHGKPDQCAGHAPRVRLGGAAPQLVNPPADVAKVALELEQLGAHGLHEPDKKGAVNHGRLHLHKRRGHDRAAKLREGASGSRPNTPEL